MKKISYYVFNLFNMDKTHYLHQTNTNCIYTMDLRFGTGHQVEERISTFLQLSCTLQFSKEENEKAIAIRY